MVHHGSSWQNKLIYSYIYILCHEPWWHPCHGNPREPNFHGPRSCEILRVTNGENRGNTTANPQIWWFVVVFPINIYLRMYHIKSLSVIYHPIICSLYILYSIPIKSLNIRLYLHFRQSHVLIMLDIWHFIVRRGKLCTVPWSDWCGCGWGKDQSGAIDAVKIQKMLQKDTNTKEIQRISPTWGFSFFRDQLRLIIGMTGPKSHWCHLEFERNLFLNGNL